MSIFSNWPRPARLMPNKASSIKKKKTVAHAGGYTILTCIWSKYTMLLNSLSGNRRRDRQTKRQLDRRAHTVIKVHTCESSIFHQIYFTSMSRDTRFPTTWYVRAAKHQISLHLRAFASRMSISLLTEHYLECLSLKGAAQACLNLLMSKCHIVWNHLLRLKNMWKIYNTLFSLKLHTL